MNSPLSVLTRCSNLLRMDSLSWRPNIWRCFSRTPKEPVDPDDPDVIRKKNRKRARYVPMDPATADPWKRAINVLKFGYDEMWSAWRSQRGDLREEEAAIFPQFCDILIVGGGIMGSCIAYYVKSRIPQSLTIVVVEKDPTYSKAASTNSFGAVRCQFSQDVNVKAALFGADFLRKMEEHLNIYQNLPKSVEFNPQGFLFLGTQADVAQMEVNHETQTKWGAKVALLSPSQLARNYPWMNLEGIALGSYGMENEGWYDTWKLLYALKEKNMSWGVHYVDGEVTGFNFDQNFRNVNLGSASGVPFDKLSHAIVDTDSHGEQQIQFAYCINAAGASAGDVSKLTGLGKMKGMRCVPLPIEKRKRLLFSFHCPDGPKLSFPILVDPNGIEVRRDGINGMFVCQHIPKTNEEQLAINDTKAGQTQFFEDVIWPKLTYRVPAFEKLQLRGAWSTYYDYNYFDQSGIVGPHPYYFNFYQAAGFSGYGIQHAPAVGKATLDLIYESNYDDEDMNKFEFERLLHFEPVKEVVLD